MHSLFNISSLFIVISSSFISVVFSKDFTVFFFLIHIKCLNSLSRKLII
jgi:hypothetical protein